MQVKNITRKFPPGFNEIKKGLQGIATPEAILGRVVIASPKGVAIFSFLRLLRRDRSSQ